MLIEGYSEDEILARPAEQARKFILIGEPVVFRIGSATVLGEFCVTDHSLYM